MGHGMHAGGRGGRPMSDINVIPLVDVMLVLLVVFIVTAPLLTHAVKLDLPRASSRPNVDRAERVEVAVQHDGSIHWNGEAVSYAELEQRAAHSAGQTPQPEIHLKGDRTVPYGDMARVLSALARQGLSRIGFVTDPEGGAEP
ncbi:MAG: biopolymer transporter ExbD [Burkholderiales bacterium 70-64]|nr:MAG: biopolymer transporter ExbD [Burkholderiales bacterium 70-64]